MASDPLTLINTRVTPQSQQADPRQVPNSAGGHVFALDDLARLRRFLTLGTVGGTYYVGERDLTADSAAVVLHLARTRGADVVAEIVTISTGGRAPKQDPAILALAAVAGVGDVEARRAAMAALPLVCRTGSHLFTFAKYIEQFRGWGRVARRGVAAWYLDKPVEKLAYQLIKYRERQGWTHRDMLRLAHPETTDPARRAAFDFACGRVPDGAPWLLPARSELRLLEGFLKAQDSANALTTAALVSEYRLPWEALKPEHLGDAGVWGALLDMGMPQTALMRNLPRLTRLGLLTGSRGVAVAEQLAAGMSRAKVHPINVLIAQRTYASGASVRGDSTWTPRTPITDALDAGFYEAFGGVEPAGKRTLIALDVSGSMGMAKIANLPITPREASAAMAMVTLATEPDVEVVGFTSTGGGYWTRDAVLTHLDLSPRRRLDDNIRAVANLPFGGTDCALPWTQALAKGLELDTVITYTDNETWAGGIHPYQAMRQYRERAGIPARSIVVGMTSTGFTVNDPSDPLGLDVAGFDSAVPNLIADFSAGRI